MTQGPKQRPALLEVSQFLRESHLSNLSDYLKVLKI